jgi:hypothetical protein
MFNFDSNFTDGKIPITIPISYDLGGHYYYAWIIYMIILVLGVFLNSLAVCFMIFNEKISRQPGTIFLMYLAVQDLCASVTCLVQCAVNIRFFMIFGEHIACIIEAWQICFFVGISGFSVCLYGYYLWEKTNKFHSRPKYVMYLDKWGLLKVHLVAWTIYAVLAFLATYWPGKARPMSSGTYCMPALEQPASAVFFFGLNVFPCAIFLIVNYYSIYRIVADTKNDLEEGATTENKINKRLVIQFSAFVLVYCSFYLPFLLATCYEWVTNFYSSVYFDIVAGALTHAVEALDPIMYFLTTRYFIKEFKKIISSTKNLILNTP